MTVYYINPSTGNNANSGNSFANAWKNLYALRVNAVVLAAGDSVRFAESTTKTTTSGPSSNGGNTRYRNQDYHYINDSSGVLRKHLGGAGTWVSSQSFTTFSTVNLKSVTFEHATILNTVSIKMCYRPLGTPNFSLYQNIMFGVIMSTAYTGTGEADIAPGTFELRLCSDTIGAVTVVTVPMDRWIRNSTTIGSYFFYKHGSNLPTNINSCSIWRTAQTLTRDGASWGIKFFDDTLLQSWASSSSVGPDVANQTKTGTQQGQGQFEPVPRNLGWYANLDPMMSDTDAAASKFVSQRGTQYCETSGGNCNQMLLFEDRDLDIVGTTHQTQAGSTVALYDLNGSSGGTSPSPVILQGGVNTGSDTVTGETIFSGVRNDILDKGWLDVDGANYIEIRNISAFGGFGSIVVDPGSNTKFYKTSFMERVPLMKNATTSSNLVLDSCVVGRDGGLQSATYGNLTLTDTAICFDAANNSNTDLPSNPTMEVGTLTATNSVFGNVIGTGTRPVLKMRANASITGFTLNTFAHQSWDHACTGFDQTLSFINSTSPTTTLRYLPRIATSSAWKKVFYTNAVLSAASSVVYGGVPGLVEEFVLRGCSGFDSVASVAGMQSSGILFEEQATTGYAVAPVVTFDPLINFYNPTVSGALIQKAFVKSLPTPPYTITSSISSACRGVYIYPACFDQSLLAFPGARRVQNLTRKRTGAADYKETITRPFLSKPDGELPFMDIRPQGGPAGVANRYMFFYGVNNEGTGVGGAIVSNGTGPVVNYVLEGGRTYKLKMGVIGSIVITQVVPTISIVEGVTSMGIAPDVGGAANPRFVTFGVVSRECFGGDIPSVTYAAPTVPGNGRILYWDYPELLLYPVATGEVAVYVWGTCIVDNLLIEEL